MCITFLIKKVIAPIFINPVISELFKQRIFFVFRELEKNDGRDF